MAGAGVWWLSRDAGDSDAEVGSEEAVASGKKLAKRLSGEDEAVIELQAVASPGLFYYATPEEALSEGENGVPFVNNELIVNLTQGDGGDSDSAAHLKVTEQIAKDLDARVVGVNTGLSSYQLLLPEPASPKELEDLAELARGTEGVSSVEQNFLSSVVPPSDASLIDHEVDTQEAEQWGEPNDPDVGNWGTQALGAPAIWGALEDPSLALEPVVVAVLDLFYEESFDGDTLDPDLPPVAKKNRFVSPAPAAESLEGSTSETQETREGESSTPSRGEHATNIIAAGSPSDSELDDPGLRGVAPNVELVLASPHTLRYVAGGEVTEYVTDFSVKEALRFVGAKNPRAVNISLFDHDEEAPSSDAISTLLPEGALIVMGAGDEAWVGAAGAYRLVSGAPVATPHVTGLAALLFGINPGLTAEQVQGIMSATAGYSPLLYWNETGDSAAGELDDSAPSVNGAAAVQVALLSKDQTLDEFEEILRSLEQGGYPVGGGREISAQLLGVWCPPENLAGDAKPQECFNLAEFFLNDEQASLAPTDQTGRSTPSSTFLVCPDGCETGGIEYALAYYPPGAKWECVAESELPQCEGVTDEEKEKHDISYPRMVQTYRSDGGGLTHDLYLLDLRVPVSSWSDYTSLPFKEQSEAGTFVPIHGKWVSSDPSLTYVVEFAEGKLSDVPDGLPLPYVFEEGTTFSFWNGVAGGDIRFPEPHGGCWDMSHGDFEIGGAEIRFCPAGAPTPADWTDLFLNDSQDIDRWWIGQDAIPAPVMVRAD